MRSALFGRMVRLRCPNRRLKGCFGIFVTPDLGIFVFAADDTATIKDQLLNIPETLLFMRRDCSVAFLVLNMLHRCSANPYVQPTLRPRSDSVFS